MNKLLTIGVYGFTETTFFQRLIDAQVDLLCDVRSRRGVRGKEYAFANSKRLQDALKTHNIRYLHLKELAPHDAIREAQKAVDKQSGTGKRQREALGEVFIARYQIEHLIPLNLPSLVEKLGDVQRPCFFCVERLPSACHRSLLVNHLADAFSLEIQHLIP